MENRMTDLVTLFRMLNAKGISDSSPEMKHITKILNNEYDFGYRAAEYAITGEMKTRAYGTGKHKP